MKKYIITLGLLATMMVPASAQDVLNEIVKMSQATVNDTTFQDAASISRAERQRGFEEVQ